MPGSSVRVEPGQDVLAGSLDWGDPAIVASGSTFYLYSTQPLPWVNVPVETGGSGGEWGPVEDALPQLPSWAQSGETWSPEVHRFGDRWVMYFAAQLRGTDPAVHCIGDAVSGAPSGPFLPAAVPFVCQRTLGGSIDPRVSVSPSGIPYLVWKSDNNSNPAKYGMPIIWSQRLSSDGLDLLTSPTAIFTPDRTWQDSLVEAPDLVTVNGRTWLFYSAGAGYWTTDYAIGVARCAGPLGPCADTGNTPLVASSARDAGPGEESVFSRGGHYWLAYNPSCSTNGSTARPIAIDALTFGSRTPAVSP
jgi:beta-xylosidase